MTNQSQDQTANRRYIEISEIPNYCLRFDGGLPSELMLDGMNWIYESTTKDGEGDIMLWTYRWIYNYSTKLIIFND